MHKITFLIVFTWVFFPAFSSFAEEPKSYEMRPYSQSYEAKSYEMKELGTMGVSKPESAQVSKPNFAKSREPKGLVPRKSAAGATIWPGERENKAYNRCAKLKGFDEQRECALEALGMTEEDLN